TMSVKAHRMEGSSVVLTLRAGGEMAFDASAIDKIGPDEVPYPEPEEAPLKQANTEPDESSGLQPGKYAELIDRFAAQHGVSAKLVRALIQVESAYNVRARSRKGAMGLMQLMPETARQYAVADPYDPVANIGAGVRHLKSLLERYPQPLALAAYNAGEAAVQRFHGIPPYPETRDYVSRILRLVS